MTAKIEKFLQTAYSDERLAAVRAHCEDGRLSWYSCSCLVGSVTADHPLYGWRKSCNNGHYQRALDLPYARAAEEEFQALGKNDAERRKALLPLLIDEQERREQLRLEDLDAERESLDAGPDPEPTYGVRLP